MRTPDVKVKLQWRSTNLGKVVKFFQLIVTQNAAPSDNSVISLVFFPSSLPLPLQNGAPTEGLISTHFCLKFNIAGVGGGRSTVLLISQARSQHLLPTSQVYLICNRNYSLACWLRLCLFYRSKLQRIVCVTSWCTRKEAGNPKTVEWLLKPVAMAGFIHDMALMESILMESGLCYTVVRPPGLNNSKQGKLLGRLYVNVIRKFARQVFTNDGVRLGVSESN